MLKYLYIDNYKKLLNNVNLNFGDKHYFRLEKSTLVVEQNSEYVEYLYDEKKYIQDISCIIGKNQSGKTTILRAINDIFSNSKYNYLAIFESDGAYSCINRLGRKIEIRNDNEKLDIKIIKNENVSEIINSNVIIYYSNIFDKSTMFSEHDNLFDISTNTLVRKYISKKYSEKYNYIGSNSKQELNIEENEDFIEDFKKYEIVNKINYFNMLKKKKSNFVSNNFKNLFSFPENLEISFGDDIIEIGFFLEQIEKSDSYLYNALLKIHQYFDYEIVNDDEEEIYDELKEFRTEFYCFLTFEILTKVKFYYGGDIDDIINNYYGKILNKENLTIDHKSIIKLIKDIRTRKKIISVSKTIERIDDEQEEKEKTTQIDESIINNLKEIISKNEFVLRQIDLDNPINIKRTIIEIKDLLQQIIDDVKVYLESIPNINDNLQKLNDLNNILLEGTSLNYPQYTNIYYYIEDNYDIYSDYNDLVLFYEFINEIKDNLDSLRYIIIKKFNLKINSEVQIFGSKKEEKIANGINEYIYTEDNKEILQFVDDVEMLVGEFEKIIRKCKLSGELGDKKLNCKWDDKKVGDFIKLFNKIDPKTFYIVFDHEDLSSGQRAYLDMYSRLNNLKETKELENKNIMLLIDEGYVYLHPSIQIEFIQNLIAFLKVFYKKNKIQIILTSNSPFIISDIPHTNLIFMEDKSEIGNNLDVSCEYKSFGANIQNLLIKNFFMDEGTMGKFAYENINSLLRKLLSGEVKSDENHKMFKIINLIGEPIIRQKLMQLYNTKNISNSINRNKEIEYYKNRLRELGAYEE